MKNTILNLLVRLFGQKVKSLFASAAVALTLWLVAQIAKLSPELAGSVNVDAVASWFAFALIAIANVITNHFHLSALDDLFTALKAEGEPAVSIPERPAEQPK